MTILYTVEGEQEKLEINKDGVVISPLGLLGKIGKRKDGPITIFFKDISHIHFAEANMLLNGYIQFVKPGNKLITSTLTAGMDELCFVFSNKRNKELKEVIAFLEAQVANKSEEEKSKIRELEGQFLSPEEIQLQLKELGKVYVHHTKKEIAQLPEILRRNEKICALTSGLYEGNTWLIVCTNSRMIFLDKGMVFGLKQIDIPLDKVSSIQIETGLLMGKVKFYHGSKSVEIDYIDKNYIKDFAEKVNCAITSLKGTPEVSQAASNKDDVYAKLEKIASLRDKGILSEEEFVIEKKKILNAA